MQKQQITHDAAYKYALWRKLWEDKVAEIEDAPECETEGVRVAQRTVDRYVSQTAFSLVLQSMPHRTYEPCCLSGACYPPLSGTASSFLHTSLHPGRQNVVLGDVVRDEDCFCLAHGTACVGAPVQLTVRGYRGTHGGSKDPNRGLRCLLRHLPVSDVAFHTVENSRDACELLHELHVLLSCQVSMPLLEQTPVAGVALPVPVGAEVESGTSANHAECTGCVNTLLLERVMATPPVLHAFLQDIQLSDCLTHLSLHESLLSSLQAVTAYVRHTRRLTQLSLRESRHIPRADWAALAPAVAAARTLVSLDVSACDWDDECLHNFLEGCCGFLPRHDSCSSSDGAGFELGLADNALTGRCWQLLTTRAPPELLRSLRGLSLSGNDLVGGDDGAPALLLGACPGLRSLRIGGCALAASTLNRLLRSMGERSREWTLLDLHAQSHAPVAVAVAALKRVAQLPFRRGHSTLILSGVDLRDSVSKAGFGACFAALSEVDFSRCGLRDEDLQQLAAALEKAGALSLRILRLQGNELGSERRKAESALSCLCRALRISNAPRLEVLDLSNNGISLRPVLALVEQAAPLLRVLSLSMTPVAEDANGCTMLLSAVMRRQRNGGGGGSFTSLDLLCVNTTRSFLIANREILAWLWHQTAVRFISE